MPEIYPSKVISYSSEDKAFPAQNLLKASSFSKWLSAKGGSKQEVVELGFDQPVEICRLDIGNNGSAFIEVLVRRSASTDIPKVFLPSSAFLSPTEAKNETNLNRVRVFSGDELQSTTASEKWDIFRFVCMQPFNKTMSYGISFVSFHSSMPNTEEQSIRPSVSSSIVVGDLENDESLDFKPGSLFRARNDTTKTSVAIDDSPQPLSVAEKLLLAQRSSSSQQTPSAPLPSTSVSSPSRASGYHSTANKRNSTLGGDSQIKQTVDTSNRTKTESNFPILNATVSSATSPSGLTSKPLVGVIFSLSGYQNPLRSEIRRKALELGARFRQEWTSDCTHLICAFSNTPKFNEVKGKGIIVSEKWIETCHRTRSKVDWHAYRVGRAPSPRTPSNLPVTSSVLDSEDEEGSSSPCLPKRRRKLGVGGENDEDWNPSSDNTEEESDEDEAEDDEATESTSSADDDQRKKQVIKRRSVAKDSNNRRAKNSALSSTSKVALPVRPEDEDTDDEIERMLYPAQRQTSTSIQEDDQATPSIRPDLPDIFDGKHFFIHNKSIPTDEARLIRRLIVAFNGTIHDYMHADVQYVITRSTWNEEFDEVLSTNASIIFVRPDWVFSCDQQAKWVPFQKFLVVG